jgi:hypothetical protein
MHFVPDRTADLLPFRKSLFKSWASYLDPIAEQPSKACNTGPHRIAGYPSTIPFIVFGCPTRTLTQWRIMPKQVGSYLLPRNDGGRVLLIAGRTIVEFYALRIGQRRGLRLKTFPEGVQQFKLFRS